VSPEQLNRYTADGPFTCKDGSQTVSRSSVNDDFCDCADGSDEPGMVIVFGQNLHSKGGLMGCTMVPGLKPGHACDVISVVAEFMVDVAGVKPGIRVIMLQFCRRPTSSTSI
jgi:hypothetical protein